MAHFWFILIIITYPAVIPLLNIMHTTQIIWVGKRTVSLIQIGHKPTFWIILARVTSWWPTSIGSLVGLETSTRLDQQWSWWRIRIPTNRLREKKWWIQARLVIKCYWMLKVIATRISLVLKQQIKKIFPIFYVENSGVGLVSSYQLETNGWVKIAKIRKWMACNRKC